MALRENDSFHRYGPPGWSFSRHSFLLKLRFKKDCDLAKITQVGLKSRSSVMSCCSLCRYQVPGTPSILPTHHTPAGAWQKLPGCPSLETILSTLLLSQARKRALTAWLQALGHWTGKWWSEPQRPAFWLLAWAPSSYSSFSHWEQRSVSQAFETIAKNTESWVRPGILKIGAPNYPVRNAPVCLSHLALDLTLLLYLNCTPPSEVHARFLCWASVEMENRWLSLPKNSFFLLIGDTISTNSHSWLQLPSSLGPACPLLGCALLVLFLQLCVDIWPNKISFFVFLSQNRFSYLCPWFFYHVTFGIILSNCWKTLLAF